MAWGSGIICGLLAYFGLFVSLILPPHALWLLQVPVLKETGLLQSEHDDEFNLRTLYSIYISS